MSYSEATKKNFEEFTAMFKKIDREDYIPCDVADAVLEYIRTTDDESKEDDCVVWCEAGLYFEIRSIVNITKKFYKVNREERVARLFAHLYPDYEAGDYSDSDDDYHSDSDDSDTERITKLFFGEERIDVGDIEN